MTLRAHIHEIEDLRFNQGWTNTQIANKFGVSHAAIQLILGPTGHYARHHRQREILKSPQLTNKEIAEKFGICELSVSRIRGKQRHAVETNCITGLGAAWENWVAQTLIDRGYDAQLQSFGAPFDILLNGSIRIDVKSACIEWKDPGATSIFWRFVVKKNRRQNCDIYFCIIASTEDYFIIPSKDVSDNRIAIVFAWPRKNGGRQKWQQYYQRWDLLEAALAHSDPDAPCAGTA